MPPKSTKAPYSVTFFTTPWTVWPSANFSINSARFACCSSSKIARRLTTTLPRRRFNLVMRTCTSCPASASRLGVGRRSYCEPGKNARTPTSTTTPPLMRSTTLPVSVVLFLYASSSFSQVRRRNQSFCFLADVHHDTVFGVRDNLYFDDFVLRRRFMLLVILIEQFAHLL